MTATQTIPMKVRDVMTAPAITVCAESSMADIAQCLLDNHISGVPVTDASDELVGVVSESDLVLETIGVGSEARTASQHIDRLEARGEVFSISPSRATAADLMSTNVVTATLDEDLPTVAQRMLDESVNRLPVIRNGTLVGVITRHDILRSLAQLGRPSTQPTRVTA